MDPTIALFNSGRVSPQLFELVCFPRFLVENVYDGVKVIQDDPSPFWKPFGAHFRNAELPHSNPDVLRNGLNVPSRSPVTDDKTVGNRGQAAQVENKNVLAFLVQGKFLAGTRQLKKSYFNAPFLLRPRDSVAAKGSQRRSRPHGPDVRHPLSYYRLV